VQPVPTPTRATQRDVPSTTASVHLLLCCPCPSISLSEKCLERIYATCNAHPFQTWYGPLSLYLLPQRESSGRIWLALWMQQAPAALVPRVLPLKRSPQAEGAKNLSGKTDPHRTKDNQQHAHPAFEPRFPTPLYTCLPRPGLPVVFRSRVGMLAGARQKLVHRVVP
jgi:hypothetical protein